MADQRFNLNVDGQRRSVEVSPETPRVNPGCGYCMSGMVMTAAALLTKTPYGLTIDRTGEIDVVNQTD